MKFIRFFVFCLFIQNVFANSPYCPSMSRKNFSFMESNLGFNLVTNFNQRNGGVIGTANLNYEFYEGTSINPRIYSKTTSTGTYYFLVVFGLTEYEGEPFRSVSVVFYDLSGKKQHGTIHHYSEFCETTSIDDYFGLEPLQGFLDYSLGGDENPTHQDALESLAFTEDYYKQYRPGENLETATRRDIRQIWAQALGCDISGNQDHGNNNCHQEAFWKAIEAEVYNLINTAKSIIR